MSSKKHPKSKSSSKKSKTTTKKSKKSPKTSKSEKSKKQETPRDKPAKISSNESTNIAPAYPSTTQSPSLSINYILLGVIIRIASALLNPISDCDETYNYWEPTAFLLTKYGFQTWEYAPQYALRSYSYLLPQYGIGYLLSFTQDHIELELEIPPFITFYTIRIMLSMMCLFSEIYFAYSLTAWFGKRTTFLTFILLTFSSAMFNCCAAYLPQQFVLCMVLLSFGSFYRGSRVCAILFMGIAAIIGWPFIALLALPMALDCILHMGIHVFGLYVTLFGGVLCGICIGIDYIYYGKVLLAPLNLFIYNVAFSGGDDTTAGQHLYGVDDWTFYVKNLLFNWNIVYVLAIIAPITSNLMVLLIWNKKKRSKNRGRKARGMAFYKAVLNLFNMGSQSNSAIVGRLLHCILPFWIWMLFFMYMPHKEERFMFVIYPFIALNAAITLTQFRLIKFDTIGFIPYRYIKHVKGTIISVFIVLCASRSVGQVLYYRGSLDIWYKTGQYIRDNNAVDDVAKKSICVGKEWYRIPSTLFISDVANIKWIKSGFDGQLPAEFEATNVAKEAFNDKNQMEMSRFVDDVTAHCDYIVDLWEYNSVIEEYDIAKYEVIESVKFLDRKATPSGIFRTLYIPFLSDYYAVYANYKLLKRKDVTETLERDTKQ